MYHLLDNVISATVGLVYINLQPEYELPSSTRFGQFRMFGKIGVGNHPPKPPLMNNFLHGIRVLVRGYLRIRCDLSSSINFRDVRGFFKLGVHNPNYRSPQRVQSGTIGFHGYDFLLVICTRGSILHPFRDIASDRSNVAMFVYPSYVFPHQRGSPGTILVELCMVVEKQLGYNMTQKHCNNHHMLLYGIYQMQYRYLRGDVGILLLTTDQLV